jgi:Zn-dependent alcohol dehydrogenase
LKFNVALAKYGLGAGIVRGVGKNVHAIAVGDPVLLSFHACSSCEQCKDGHPAYCDEFAQENYVGRERSMSVRKTGEGVWTRFFGQSSCAQYNIVSEASVVNAKDLLCHDRELELFAPLGCGFQTGMGAIQNIAVAGISDTVMIIGMGAVGMGALMVRFSVFPFQPLKLITLFESANQFLYV